MKRREFIGCSASASVLAMISAHLAIGNDKYSARKNSDGRPARIKALRLQTIASLHTMEKFYAGTIGLPASEKNGELRVQAGETIIDFVSIEGNNKRPFYHFAFNIPENKLGAAFQWQRQKTPVIHPNPQGTKDQVVNFAHWNAHSIFFLDPAGNLLEYIARHDLHNSAPGAFSVKDILYVSEIGLIVDDTITSGNVLQRELGLAQYRDPTPGFWPIGDESGLLLMISKGRTWSGHPGQPNETDIFKTSVSIRSAKKTNWEMTGYPYVISSES